MEKEKLKNNRGIALISIAIILLVLTVIVTIGIKVAWGENNLISVAQKNGNEKEEESETKYSFIAGTKVITPKGMVNIEDIKVGDKVYTKNTETKKIEIKEVLGTLSHDYNKDFIKVYTQNASIESTINHLFYVKNKEWVRAEDLKEDDILLNNNNERLRIDKIERIANSETIKVYNLSVEDNHNYFVGIDGVLVHNCCVAPGSQILIDLEGNTKPIESIKKGDTVVAYNEETGENQLAEVSDTSIREDSKDIVTIKFKDGSTLIQNLYHPIYTKEGWKSLTGYNGYEYLENDDIVKAEEGWKEIESIDINLTSEPRDLYIIEVSFLNNFYANGTMVHDLRFDEK